MSHSWRIECRTSMTGKEHRWRWTQRVRRRLSLCTRLYLHFEVDKLIWQSPRALISFLDQSHLYLIRRYAPPDFQIQKITAADMTKAEHAVSQRPIVYVGFLCRRLYTRRGNGFRYPQDSQPGSGRWRPHRVHYSRDRGKFRRSDSRFDSPVSFFVVDRHYAN